MRHLDVGAALVEEIVANASTALSPATVGVALELCRARRGQVCSLGLGSPLVLSPRRTPPVLPEQHFEQIADPSLLCLLRQGMTQR